MEDNRQVQYRSFKACDFDELATLCARSAFDSIEGAYDRILFGRVMAAGSLRRSHIAEVACINKKVVGFCMGSLYQGLDEGLESFAPEWDPKFQEIMEAARKRAKLGGPKVEEKLFSKLRMYTMADVFISRGYTNAEAELNLICVAEKYRGLGIGSTLFENMVLSFCQQNAMGFFSTLGESTYESFFEKRGLSLVQEKTLGSGKDSHTIKILGRRL